MKAIVSYDGLRDGYDVWLYAQTPEGRVIYDIETSIDVPAKGPRRLQHTFVPTRRPEANEQVDPTIFLPAPVLDALLEAAQTRITVDDAFLVTLSDTRDTRDRLFTLVEYLTHRAGSPTPPTN